MLNLKMCYLSHSSRAATRGMLLASQSSETSNADVRSIDRPGSNAISNESHFESFLQRIQRMKLEALRHWPEVCLDFSLQFYTLA